MAKVRHVLGISGGKDSTALAVYLKNLYPELDMEYYFCDTGKELDETYQLIANLEVFLGKKIELLKGIEIEDVAPFDHFLKINGGYLPSSQARWCTTKMKLMPFEVFIGNDLAVSYVGIRGDEDREGYISTKPNIQTIFPFRKNIWSEEVIIKLLKNSNTEILADLYAKFSNNSRVFEIVKTPLSFRFNQASKLNALLNLGIKEFNQVMFEFLKTIDSVVGKTEYFPLINNEDNLGKEDIFDLLKKSGVGIPQYYTEVPYEVNGEIGFYHRSRSGCFFCFFQQKIEWVWLFEQHPDKFWEAAAYEKDGYTWIENERLENLIKPERMQQIKAEHLKRTALKAKKHKSALLLDVLNEETEGCASCFI
jgi:3'-phosphoadenosine 5'-phosphosulfate sulfotransferase (PAPS reductase)/FAD synthetase